MFFMRITIKNGEARDKGRRGCVAADDSLVLDVDESFEESEDPGF